MATKLRELGIDQWSPEERLRLAGEIWQSLDDTDAGHLTEAQKADLRLRLAEYRKNPKDVIPWEEAKKRLGWD